MTSSNVKVLVFAYYSFNDPIFQSAVLPYLKLVKNNRISFILLTWEQKEYSVDRRKLKAIRENLNHYNITWYKMSWHSGRFKIIKKVYDFLVGVCFSIYLILKNSCTKIYSEGFPGATIGHYLSLITGRAHIIHTFEPHADYMMESGVWSNNSWEYRLLKKLEIPIANNAEHIITATNAFRKKLKKIAPIAKVWNIPSCVDFSIYKYNVEKRAQKRKELGIRNNETLIVYMGKVGGMYMKEELFQFFKRCDEMKRFKMKYLLLSDLDNELLKNFCDKYMIPSNKFILKYASREEISSYLSASDIAFCGIKPIPARRYSSPIKNGEYWACGLPIIIPKGISDDYIIAEKLSIGFWYKSIEDISENKISYLLGLEREAIREKAKDVRDIDKYKKIFSSFFSE